MSVTIGRRTRAFLITASALAYVASLTDLSERLEAQGLGASRSIATQTASRRDVAFAPSLVTRDPFESVSRPTSPHSSVPAPVRDAARTAAGDPGDSADSGDPGILVPDIATGVGDAPGKPPPVVRATLVGAHAAAYVANGNDVSLVRVGDAVDGRRIVLIDVRGIAFSDGSRLDLAEKYLATPAPRATPRSRIDAVARELARLRATIERRATEVPSSKSTAPVATPRRPPEPTAWPLPTADARGLPVGVNPTPDAADPTAFPYPYPYPPAAH